jgi:transposase-like protein
VFVPSERWRKPEVRDAARSMRREGASIAAIHAALPVAKSTISLWVRDVPLDEEHRRALEAANPAVNGRQVGQRAWSRACREDRRRAQEHGRALALRGDPLHCAGCMLYWGEGSKGRNGVAFTNADPDMLRLFLRFLHESYGVRADAVRLRVNCHLGNGLSVQQIEDWWLAALALPRTCLRKSTVNRASRASKGVRRPLIHGTAQLRVGSTWLIQSIYGSIQEYAGCARPEWLDLGLQRYETLTVSPPSTSSEVPVM